MAARSEPAAQNVPDECHVAPSVILERAAAKGPAKTRQYQSDVFDLLRQWAGA